MSQAVSSPRIRKPRGDPVMRALRICLFAFLAASLVGCSSNKSDAPAPEPERDAAMPEPTETDANVPDEPDPEPDPDPDPEPDPDPDPEPEASFVIALAKDKLPILQGTREELVVE